MSRDSHDFFNFVESTLQDTKKSDSDRVNRVTALAWVREDLEIRTEVLRVLHYFWSFNFIEIAASESAHATGILFAPRGSTLRLPEYYLTCCTLDGKPSVIVMPGEGGWRTLLVWVPNSAQLPRSLRQVLKPHLVLVPFSPDGDTFVGFGKVEWLLVLTRLVAMS